MGRAGIELAAGQHARFVEVMRDAVERYEAAVNQAAKDYQSTVTAGADQVRSGLAQSTTFVL